MFPHQNNIRERRVGQPPMAPQHLMGMPQQGPGVLMPMPTPAVQIMTQNHYPNQNSYSAQGQSNLSQYVPPQQVPPQKSSYHHAGYNHNNPQVILTKQANNRNKNYRKDYNMIKDPVNYNMNNHYNHHNNFHPKNGSSPFGGYHHGNFKSHYQSHASQEKIQKSNINHENLSTLKEKGEDTKDSNSKVSEIKQEVSTASQKVVTGAKEKTPMCVVNELARLNKITHQYRLTKEQGPAHKKSFTVTLNLGNEEYTAEGPSIKKAQHSAAAEALSKTSYSHPLPKVNKNINSTKPNITPTVELNALAMKRGDQAVYKLIEPMQPPQVYQAQSSFNYRRPFGRNGRMGMKAPYMQNFNCTVSLKVGSWEFFGEGFTPQAARHDAASKALVQLKALPVPEQTCLGQKENCLTATQDSETAAKSPISLVYELALKRVMSVSFEVINERGPPHMKIYVTKCTVGKLTTTGEGKGKRLSKKRAAENMVVELEKIPPVPPTFKWSPMAPNRMKKKFPQTKKKSRNLIKIDQESEVEKEAGGEVNPISKLSHLQQVKKEKAPVYTLVEEKGSGRKREFLMEVSIGQMKATGSGPNKKIAKKAAAQNLLNQMSYVNQDNPSKAGEGSQEPGKDRKVAFGDPEKAPENNAGGSAGRQLKPGLYVMSTNQHVNSGFSNSNPTQVNIEMTSIIAKELLKGGKSPTADALLQNSVPANAVIPQGGCHSFRPKDQLLYLANLLNFQVHFSDFPKGNHTHFLSLVTMSMDPSHVCHGSGQTMEDSQDQAALTALRALAQMGIDPVAQNTTTELATTRRDL